MDNSQLRALQMRAFSLTERKNAPEGELKAFIIELCNEISKQHKEHTRNNDLIEAVVENISISEIANEG